MNLGVIFVSEMVGTAMLLLLGCGVVANVALAKTKGNAGGTLMVNWGWGLAVFAGVIVSAYSGAQLNPAVSIGRAMSNSFAGIAPASLPGFIAAQVLGAAAGAALTAALFPRGGVAQPLDLPRALDAHRRGSRPSHERRAP